MLGMIRSTRRTRRVTSGLALGVGALMATTLCGVGAATADAGDPPERATHRTFSETVRTISAGKTPQERAALTTRALRGEAAGKQLQDAYNIGPLLDNKIDGSGTTVATLVSFGDKQVKEYLEDYSKQHGLPAPDIETIEPAGEVPACDEPGVSPDCPGWGAETDLDVAMIHTLAPGAKIQVIATPTAETQGIDGFPDMMKAMDHVAENKTADVISMSLGTPEDDFDNPEQLHELDQHFKKASDAGIPVVASSGDDGSTGKKKDGSPWGKQVVSFPAASSFVTAVGGTELQLDNEGHRTGPDVLWDRSGGGVSHEYDLPDWQRDVAGDTGAKGRSLPDISLQGVEGTSQSAPLFAGVLGLATQQAGKPLGFISDDLYKIGPQGEKAGLVDVTEGNNGYDGVPGFEAGPGFDIVSGWGTLDAAKFVPALVEQIG